MAAFAGVEQFSNCSCKATQKHNSSASPTGSVGVLVDPSRTMAAISTAFSVNLACCAALVWGNQYANISSLLIRFPHWSNVDWMG